MGLITRLGLEGPSSVDFGADLCSLAMRHSSLFCVLYPVSASSAVNGLSVAGCKKETA